MTTKRFFFVMIVLDILALALILGVSFWGNGLIKEQSTKLQTAKTESKVIEEQQVSLIQAKKDIEKYSELNTIVKSVVPQDKDQAKTVREISKVASESGVVLKDVRFQTSNLGQAIAKPPADAPATATNTAPPISQVKTLEGIQGVYALEIIISSPEDQPTSYSSFIKFLEKLETNRRTAHVDKITIKPLDGGNFLAFTLTLNAYVKP